MDQTAQKPLIRVRRFLATCAFAIVLAFVINAAFGDRTLPAVLLEGQPIGAQIGWGITFGLAISVPSVVVVFFVPQFSSLRKQLLDLVSRVDLDALNPLWISLSAGIGRAALPGRASTHCRSVVRELDLYACSFPVGPVSLNELAKTYLCNFCLHCRVILGVCVP